MSSGSQPSFLQILAEEPPAHIANRRAPQLGRLRGTDADADDEDSRAAVISARALAKEMAEKSKSGSNKPASDGKSPRRASSSAVSRSQVRHKEEEEAPNTPKGLEERNFGRHGSQGWQRGAHLKSPSATNPASTVPIPISTAEKLALLTAATHSEQASEPAIPATLPELPVAPKSESDIKSSEPSQPPAPSEAKPTPAEPKPSTLFPRHYVRAATTRSPESSMDHTADVTDGVYSAQRRETFGDAPRPPALEKLPKDQKNFKLHFGELKSAHYVAFGTFGASASLETTLNSICSTKSSGDHSLREEFLLVYTHFMRPDQLVDALIDLFAWEGSDKAGIFDFLNSWILNFYDDLRDHNAAAEKLSTWLLELKKKKPFMNPVEVITRSLAQVRHKRPPLDFVIDSRESDWQKLSTDDIAVQLTLISHDLLKKIPIRQFIDHPWIMKPELSVQIRACIARFNFVSSWTATQVVSNTLAKKRAKILKTLISVAVKLRKLRNYDAMMAVVQGLDRSASTRLKQTWENVPKKDLATMIELTELCSPAGNYNALKTLQNSAPLPCVPYLGVHLTELVYIDEEKSQTPLSELNWVKMKKLAEKLTTLQTIQQAEYTRKSLTSLISNSLVDVSVIDSIFQKNDMVVADCILNLAPVYDDETLYRLSAYVEPKNASTSVGPTPKELLSPERRQLLESVANQGEDEVILQKRQEQKRINRLRQLVADFVEALPLPSEMFEVQLVPGLSVSLAGEDSVTVDAVVSALVPKILELGEVLAVGRSSDSRAPLSSETSASPASDGFYISLRDESAFLKIAALSIVKISGSEYSVNLVQPLRVRVKLTDLPFPLIADPNSLRHFLGLFGSIQHSVIEYLEAEKYPLPTGAVLAIFHSVHSLFARQSVLPGTKIHLRFLDDSSIWEKSCIDDSGFSYLPSQIEVSAEDSEALSETTEGEGKSDQS